MWSQSFACFAVQPVAEPLAAIVLNEMVESIIREVLVGPIFDCTYLDIVHT